MATTESEVNPLVLVIFTLDPRVLEAQARRNPPPRVLQAKTPDEALNLIRAHSPRAFIYDVDAVADKAIAVDDLLPRVVRDFPRVKVVAYSQQGGNRDLIDIHVTQRMAHTSVDASEEDSQWVNTMGGILDDGEFFIINREVKLHIRPLVGQAAVMQALRRELMMLAPVQTTVHICGPTGTGKELAARLLHLHNPLTAHLPFISLSATELAESAGGVAESQLFGKVKGAFTGADATTAGVFEAANGGTVFMDEIGDLPMVLQGKTLRVLQELDVLPVGGTKRIPVRFRLITGTHRDLKQMVKEGKFREDLYYRIVVSVVTMPPLRDRKEDIPSLMEHFSSIHSPLGYPRRRFSEKTLKRLARYDFPGNVRELGNIVETLIARAGIGRAVIISRDLDKIRGFEQPVDDQDDEVAEEKLIIEPYHAHLERKEREYLAMVLKHCKGNRSKASRLMQLDRKSLWEKMKKYKMDEHL